MGEEASSLEGQPESLDARDDFQMFNRLPAELQDMIWQHAAEDVGPQMLYLEVNQLEDIGWELRDEQFRPPNRSSRDEGPENPDRVSNFVDHDKLDRKLYSRRRLSRATRSVRALGGVCKASRKWICRSYPDVLGLQFSIPNGDGTCSGVWHGPPDGSESKVPGDYYTLRINGRRDLCVLPLSSWERQACALRNPKDILSSLVPRCIRSLGLDLETLSNDRVNRTYDHSFGFINSCACGFDMDEEYSFPYPHGVYGENAYRGNPISDYCESSVVCPSEPFVPFLKGLKDVETVVLVGVSDPLIAFAEPVFVDGLPFSRRVNKIRSWAEADGASDPDTLEQCTRAFDRTDNYASMHRRGTKFTGEAPPPALRWIQTGWGGFPYEYCIPEIKFRVVRREKAYTLSDLITFFKRHPKYPIDWTYDGMEPYMQYAEIYHELSDDEDESPWKWFTDRKGRGLYVGYNADKFEDETGEAHTRRHVPCIFELDDELEDEVEDGSEDEVEESEQDGGCSTKSCASSEGGQADYDV